MYRPLFCRSTLVAGLIPVAFLLTGLAGVNRASAQGQDADPDKPILMMPAAIMEYGFRQSRVVIVNEAHAGKRRSKRTRLVGRLMLPRAHASGARYLAVEALTVDVARRSNETRVLPPSDHAYLAQADMREFLQSALDLGWNLIAYEAALETMGYLLDDADGTKGTDAVIMSLHNTLE